ncbi:hypothetical protein EVAR_81931_1 [Eumeta japonica]|uniref:Uncharacterized protein n=1 Tax=Eumeta variegata TaxID=151549 RepID=A0A4C1UX12_EUMVA|nr:hypothetical protein EVAR_81931_1 [Eumeta japonica]
MRGQARVLVSPLPSPPSKLTQLEAKRRITLRYYEIAYARRLYVRSGDSSGEINTPTFNLKPKPMHEALSVPIQIMHLDNSTSSKTLRRCGAAAVAIQVACNKKICNMVDPVGHP